MSHQSSYFELHAGFPDDKESASAADRFLKAGASGRPWTRSAVTAVHMKSPGCIDPHNVPGTLGSLVSCAISNEGASSWESVVADAVVPTCAAALEALGLLGAHDSRLEIECPFGWLSVRDTKDGLVRVKSISEPVRISPEILRRLPGGIPDIPQWEIHFVAEPRIDVVSAGFSIESLPSLIERHGVDIEQTIQYRSQSMIEAGSAAYKFISTSYYPTPADVVSEATRILEDTPLAEELWSEGYHLTLILEHIVGCYEPIATTNRENSNSLIEVPSAR